MKIIADKAIADVLVSFFKAVSDQDFYIVQLEQADAGHHRQDMMGLDATLKVANEGIPVVMLGWLAPEMYIDRKPQEWFAAMGYPNVAFLRLPDRLLEMMSVIEEMKTSARRADPLAIALLGVSQTNTAIQILNHDLSSAQRDAERMMRWEERARGIFGDKSQDELVALVEEAARSRSVAGKLAGQTFPDVCVDIEGTLLDSEGQLRPEVLALAKEKANGGPITLWTGGDVEALSKKVHMAGVFYKIAPKSAMDGATVRIVIDNEPEATFQSDNGIRYEEYIQV